MYIPHNNKYTNSQLPGLSYFYFDGSTTSTGQLRRVNFDGSTSMGQLQRVNFDDLLLIGKQVF